MELLNEKYYYKASNSLVQVQINTLFARAVIEHRVDGKIFVDNTDDPKTFYIVHPYGMSLLYGNWQNENFNKQLLNYSLNLNKVRNKHEWMQAYPSDWDNVLLKLYDDHLIISSDNHENKTEGIVELNTRNNFKFNIDKYNNSKRATLSSGCDIVRTDEKIFAGMKGSVIPSYFWNNANDFVNHGVGFSLFFNDELATTAYSAYVHDHQLELGIETIPKYRGKGFAYLACSALIDFCVKNNYEPVWSCRLENVGSCKLAEKLGFEVTVQIPYYRLSN